MKSPHAVGRSSLGGRAPYVTLYLQVRGDKVDRAMFQTYGCGVSIACCSVLTELITGRAIADCRSLNALSLIDTLAGIPDEKQFCASMAIEALQDAITKLATTTETAAK